MKDQSTTNRLSVAELKEALETSQEELRISEERMKGLIDQSPFSVQIMDPDGRTIGVNKAWEQLWGVPWDELKNADHNILKDEQLIENGIMPYIERAFSGETVSIPATEYTVRETSGKGNKRWAKASIYPIKSASGEVLRVIAMHEDFSDRIQAEETLRESETTYRELINNLSAGVVVHGADTAILIANPAACRVLGLTEDQLRGIESISPDWKFLRADSSPMPHEEYPITQVISTKKAIQNLVVGVNRPSTDDIAWALVNGFPVISDEGQIQQAIISFTDITEHRRMEEEKADLERQVQHAQKLESLGVLAGGIAHDFNNLLMTILGNADLALSDLSPMSPARKNIQEIERASRRAADLARQMLAYSGKGRFVVQSIDATELIQETAHLLEVSISKKAVLKYKFADNVPTFDGDVTQVRQVIMNLITNASEAVGDKSGVIALSTGAMDCDHAYLNEINDALRVGLEEPLPEGIYTYFEVADTGCGMDKETKEKIFDPFFTTKFTGRGLGMSAVLGIVRGHKGALKLYSEEGKGTTFKVLFPANASAVSSTGLSKQANAQQDPQNTGTVLVADDEETICAVTKQMLERMGFSVLIAPDGREALKLFNEHKDDIVCVILDLTMPHMDGEEAFRELRRIKPDANVILCSGYNEQDATQRFAGKGLAGFIQKPFSLAALRDKLAEALSD